MIAAALLAASVLAPAGVTAGIQADPVCLPVTAQPGHSYPLTVSVSGSGPLALTVIPAHAGPQRQLHQVPASWVRFAVNPAGPGQVALTLAIPAGAAAGAYWSDIEAGTQGQPGAGAQAALGAAATTGIVFTVGPSATPPPPCDALDLAQSTGQFPPWPAKAFATSSWAQVFARDGSNARPDGPPTAGTGPAQVPSAKVTPVAYMPAASGHMSPAMAKFIGWAVVIVIIAAGLTVLLKLLGLVK